jgi:TPR repeat protein
MRILKPLAEQGDMNAQFMVGTLYDNGYGVPRDGTEAALWFRKAAEQGHTLAATSLGMLTLYGDGVPKNYADAMKWYLQAAKQGDAGAQSSLGLIYKRGYGVPQNYILAYMWYTVSAHDPDEKFFVKKSLDEISPHMAPSQIAEAERLARQCLQSDYTVCNSAPQTTEHW